MGQIEMPFIGEEGKKKKITPEEEKSLKGLPEFEEMRPEAEGREPTREEVKEMSKAQDPSFERMSSKKRVERARKKAHHDFFEPELPFEKK